MSKVAAVCRLVGAKQGGGAGTSVFMPSAALSKSSAPSARRHPSANSILAMVEKALLVSNKPAGGYIFRSHTFDFLFS